MSIVSDLGTLSSTIDQMYGSDDKRVVWGRQPFSLSLLVL